MPLNLTRKELYDLVWAKPRTCPPPLGAGSPFGVGLKASGAIQLATKAGPA